MVLHETVCWEVDQSGRNVPDRRNFHPDFECFCVYVWRDREKAFVYVELYCKKKTLVWTIKGLAEHSGKKQRLMNMKNMSKVTPSLRSYTLYGYKVSSTSMIVLSTDRIV